MAYLRIILDPPRSAAFNMAADIWALEHVPENCLWVRFYAWQAPTITLGYMQKAGMVLDAEACTTNGIDRIRRITGGRAVLHAEDITYSCIYPRTISCMGDSIAQSYAIIAECLVRGLSLVNIAAHCHAVPGSEACDNPGAAGPREQSIKLPCFIAANRKEIMVAGKKLVGSAQKRTERGVLQHGSLPISSAYRRLPDYLRLTCEQRKEQKRLLREKSICVHEIAPALDSAALIPALAHGFIARLNFDAVEKPWTEKEFREISALSASGPFMDQWIKSN